jgi:beta-mannosidase
VSLRASHVDLREALESFRAAGMNMVRLPGFGPYEQVAFHELCDELGILVWQDLMFASLDYPFDDPSFGGACETEVRDVAERLGGRPSSAVVCGNSEVEQQVAMLGLDMSLARIPFYDESAPRLMAEIGVDAVYVPSSPFGGDLPMRADRGVTNYYGVGGYRQPLSDARTSGLRFAGESLAFANIPDDEALATLVPEPPFEPFMHHPRWKAGVARDAGSGWDFDDLRDHYLGVVYGVDPIELRRDDTARYLELSRVVTGEVMAHAYGEWRRAESPCAGALILWWRDLVPGAGYGIVDNRGRPKTPWFALRRALAPAAVWLVDERTGGVIAHVANDGAVPLRARLRVRLYSDLELEVGGGDVALEVPAHGAVHRDVEAIVGHFVDAAWAFRFGPPAQDVIVATLERDGPAGPELLSQAFHFPAGWPLNREPARRLGLGAALDDAGGSLRLEVSSRRLAYAVRVHVPGFTPSDDAFSVEPGGSRTIELRPDRDDSRFDGGWLSGLNLAARREGAARLAPALPRRGTERLVRHLPPTRGRCACAHAGADQPTVGMGRGRLVPQPAELGRAPRRGRAPDAPPRPAGHGRQCRWRGRRGAPGEVGCRAEERDTLARRHGRREWRCRDRAGRRRPGRSASHRRRRAGPGPRPVGDADPRSHLPP